MTKLMAALSAAFMLVALANPAEAKRHYYGKSFDSGTALQCAPDNNGHTVCLGSEYRTTGHSRAGKHIAKKYHRHNDLDANGNGVGNVRSHKTSARATVSSRAAGVMQAYIDDIEANGGIVYFMGGNRRGGCSPRHMHSCGLALDVCQLSRGVVAAKCHLPGRAALAQIAARHGLFEGGLWCNSDYGHAQLGVSAGACGTTLMARRHHHRHSRYASR